MLETVDIALSLLSVKAAYPESGLTGDTGEKPPEGAPPSPSRGRGGTGGANFVAISGGWGLFIALVLCK